MEAELCFWMGLELGSEDKTVSVEAARPYAHFYSWVRERDKLLPKLRAWVLTREQIYIT